MIFPRTFSASTTMRLLQPMPRSSSTAFFMLPDAWASELVDANDQNREAITKRFDEDREFSRLVRFLHMLGSVDSRALEMQVYPHVSTMAPPSFATGGRKRSPKNVVWGDPKRPSGHRPRAPCRLPALVTYKLVYQESHHPRSW